MDALFESLARAALQGAAFIAAVAILCRVCPRLPATIRCWLWWAASLKLVLGIVWLEPVALPLLRAPAPVAIVDAPVAVTPAEVAIVPARLAIPSARGAMVRAPAAFVSTQGPTVSAPAAVVSVPSTVTAPAAPSPAQIDWRRILLALWGAGVAIQILLVGRSAWGFRRTVLAATAASDPAVTEVASAIAASLGLRAAPTIRISDTVTSPQASGLVRPVVIVPRALLDRPAELRMALQHELTHIRRGDLWLGWVPVAARCLQFWNPLAHLASREYALAREAACDAAVVGSAGVAPRAYGQLLLAIGISRTGGLAAAMGGTTHGLKRRLEMLSRSSHVTRWQYALLIAVVAVAGLLPVRLVAKAAVIQDPPPFSAGTGVAPRRSVPAALARAPRAPSPSTVAPVAVAPAPPAPSTPPTPPALPTPALAPVAMPMIPRVPRAPRAPRAARIPRVPRAPRAMGMLGDPFGPGPVVEMGDPFGAGGDGDQGDDAYVLMSQKTTMMHGDTGDLSVARALRGRLKADVLWMRRGGKSYVIEDASTVKAAGDVLAQQGKIGEQQGAIGSKQGAIGSKQGALGLKQAELGVEQAKLAHREAQMALLKEGAARRKAELEIEEQQAELEVKEAELEREQARLGADQADLAVEQAKLAQQQARIAREVDKKIWDLLDGAIKKGAAKPAE